MIVTKREDGVNISKTVLYNIDDILTMKADVLVKEKENDIKK